MLEAESAYGLINLQSLNDSLLVEFEGDEGIFIPFRANPSIAVSDRGVHLCIRISPMRSGKDNFGNTHCCYATPRKDIKDLLSEEDKKRLLPYLGKFYISAGDKSPDGIPRTKSGIPVVKRLDTVKPCNPSNEDGYEDFPF